MENLSCFNIKKGEKRKKLYLFGYEIVLFLLRFVVTVNLVNKRIRKLNDYYSEIHLVVQGNGTQKILSDYYRGLNPSEVYVNGVKDASCRKSCNLYGNLNNITLRFENQIGSCKYMFKSVTSIIEVDLSNFDASKVKSMESMFILCSNLKKINFGNIDTSSVENMRTLFSCCYSLSSIINLSKLNTSRVREIDYMFNKCESLKYLDLSNFDTSKITNIERLFFNCTSLLYLNLYSFKLNNSVTKSYFFDGVSPNIKYCINDEETDFILFNNKKKSNCSDICLKKNIIYDPINNTCIDSCSKDENKYKYNDICYNECPINTFIIDNNTDINKY